MNSPALEFTDELSDLGLLDVAIKCMEPHDDVWQVRAGIGFLQKLKERWDPAARIRCECCAFLGFGHCKNVDSEKCGQTVKAGDHCPEFVTL